MADKMAIDLGRYDKLFQKGIIGTAGKSYLQTLIDSRLVSESNAYYWMQPGNYTVDPINVPLPPGRNSKPTFEIKNVVRQLITLPDVHETMAEVSQKDKDGHAELTGTIPTFAHGLYDNTYSREELKDWMESLGGDAALVNQYIKDTSDFVLGHMYNISRLCAARTSTGGGETHLGQGGKLKIPNMVPSINFRNLGAKSIDDPTCDILESLKAIQDPILMANGEDKSMWRTDVDDVSLQTKWLANASVIKEVNKYILAYGRAAANVIVINGEVDINQSITKEDILAYSRSPMSKIAPIYENKEYQSEQQIVGRFSTRGWQVGNIVFRRNTWAGVIKKSKVKDIDLLEREAALDLIVNSASTMNGLVWIANIVRSEGMLRAYHTNVYGSYLPILSDFMNHYIISSTNSFS